MPQPQPTMPAQHRRGHVSLSTTPMTKPHPSFSSSSPLNTSALLLTCLLLATLTSAATLTPNSVGGFAICQTASSFHIQGGVSFDSGATYLLTTNQHFRLDLSQPFDGTSSSPPVWANLTSDYSPRQRFHAGACAPDQTSFLTVGNADAQNTGSEGNGFMMAYSVNKGTWSAVSQAVSSATNENGGNKDKGKGGNQDTGVNGAGRTMVGFAIGSIPRSGPKTALGIVVGGGWLLPKTMTHSAMATDMADLVTEADLISVGGDGSMKDLQWKVASGNGNGKNDVNTNLGPLAGAKIVIAPGNKAIVLGGVTKGQSGGINGLSFGNLPVVDMASGSVTIQKTQVGSGLNGVPSSRYGHCVALSADGDIVYMFGGAFVSNDRLSSELYGLDLRTWTWFRPSIKQSNIVPPSVRDHQCIVVGDQFMSFFGFNGNAVPASSTPGVSLPIYVLSTSSWMWSTRYTPLPGTPSPPKPPNVPTDGKGGKINGVGIGFGVVFGAAFLGVIGYLVYAHKRRQRRKAERLVLLEMEQSKKEEEQLEKKKQQELQEYQDAPLPAIPGEPDTAYMYNANYYNDNGNHLQQQYQHQHQHQQQYQQPYDATYSAPPQASVPTNPGSPYYQAPNPFQNPGYYQPPQQPAVSPQQPLAPNPYYASASVQHGSTTFVPEEMGYTPHTMGHTPLTMGHSQGHPGHYRGP